MHYLSMMVKKRKNKTSSNLRSMKYLQKLGYTVGKTEHWNSFTQRRHDLLGFIDLMAFRNNQVLAVQACGSSVSSRIDKIFDSKHIDGVLNSGARLVIISWRKNKKTQKFHCKLSEIKLTDKDEYIWIDIKKI